MVGNDISGFADPDYLPVAAEAGATVVATHIRLGPRIPDPEPVYDDVVDAVRAYLVERAGLGRGGRPPADRIVLDAGLDLGKTAAQSLTLLRASDQLADLGLPAPPVGVQQDVPRRGPRSRDRRAPGGVAGRRRPRVPLGCRVMRVHDVAAHRQVCDVMAAVEAAGRMEPAVGRDAGRR